MVAEIKVPTVGESITEVIIAQWLKPEGSQVTKDEPLVSLETDKVNVDVPAPASGLLQKILRHEQETATIGEVIGRIEEGAPATPSAPAPSEQPKPAAGPGAGPAAISAPPAPPAATPTVMPAAQRVMAQHNVPRDAVAGTGPGGRVLKEDALAAAAKSPAQPAAADSDSTALEETVPMTPMRRRIAERLVQAQQTAAILTTFNEVDMGHVMALRKRLQDGFVKKYSVKLGFMSFFVKASIDALREFPEVNAEVRGTNVVYRNYYDIGVAVGGEKGLVVPVLRKAELMSFAEIEIAISEYAKRASAGKIKLEDLQGGTFTISNGGVYGSLMSTPIINPPQSGILGMHAIVDRPVGIDGKIELRPMMYLALSYDHRIVDGRGAVSFLKRIKECIEDPTRMLVEA